MPDLSSFAAFVPKLADYLVYAAIGLVTLIGLLKCLIPLWTTTHALRRSVRKLQNDVDSKHDKPIWQESRFMGRRLKGCWQRFLLNAEQLDRRGLPCNVEDYINDDTVTHGPGNAQLAELIPSLLTSLGILGTFMGLMSGLSGLDFADSTKLIEGIPTLLEGMKYAFATSVAGITCSLLFNMLNRIAVGSSYRAIDDFTESFTQLAMQRPLDNDVQLICQNQDRNALLTNTTGGLASQMAGCIELAVTRAMTPVTQSMDSFLVGATRAQVDGVNRIVGQFVDRMNVSLNDQFLALGKTLSAVNQHQLMSFERVEESLRSANAIVADVEKLHGVSADILTRFEKYVSELGDARQRDAAFEQNTAELLQRMQRAAESQSAYIGRLNTYQTELEKELSGFTDKAGDMMNAMNRQSSRMDDSMTEAMQSMKASSEKLSDSYSGFVQNVVEGLSATLGMFDENVHGVFGVMQEKIDALEKSSGKNSDTARQLSQIQQLMASISDSLQAIVKGKEAE